MVGSRPKHLLFLALLTLFLLLFTYEMKTVEAACTVQKLSKTWSGWCGSSNNCRNQCKKYEGACFGACHWHRFGRACFCYYHHK